MIKYDFVYGQEFKSGAKNNSWGLFPTKKSIKKATAIKYDILLQRLPHSNTIYDICR